MEFAAAQAELNRQYDILDEYINRKENYLIEAEKLRNEETLPLQDILDNQYATAQMDVMIASQYKIVQEHEAEVEKVMSGSQGPSKKQEEAKENDQRSSFTYGQRQQENN